MVDRWLDRNSTDLHLLVINLIFEEVLFALILSNLTRCDFSHDLVPCDCLKIDKYRVRSDRKES